MHQEDAERMVHYGNDTLLKSKDNYSNFCGIQFLFLPYYLTFHMSSFNAALISGSYLAKKLF